MDFLKIEDFVKWFLINDVHTMLSNNGGYQK